MESSPQATTTPFTTTAQTFTIAGFKCVLYGLSRLPPPPCTLTAVYLFHPRLETARYMDSIASAILTAHHSSPLAAIYGVFCLAFDQRNHGSRELDGLRVKTWREGNELHAQDLFSGYQGTAADLSSIIDYLPSYLFRDGNYLIEQHIAAGVSLGGHAAWQAVMHEPRISAAGVIIGCPDFVRLMEHRSEKSRLEDFAIGGSKHFPESLLEVVERRDPAAIAGAQGIGAVAEKLRGKSILQLSGGADKLVPFECSKEFLDELGKAEGVGVESIVYEGIGHECTGEMVAELTRWVCRILATKLQARLA